MLLVLVSVYIRLHGAGEYSYSGDESMHTDIAEGRNAPEVWRFSFNEAHPPMLYLLCHYWMKISTSPAFVRGLSLLFGMLLIPLYYLIGSRLDGAFTGMCCAALIAFSHGCIILSYVVRHYMIFLFFVSSAFYCYLRWRKEHKTPALAGYSLLGCLAAATHFSTLFAVFCIGACESISMLRRRAGRREWLPWIAANGAILAVGGGLYFLWLPQLTLMQSFYYDLSSYRWSDRIAPMLLYPISSAIYLFPCLEAALPLTIFFMAMALWPGSAARRNPDLRFLIGIMGFAFALGMALFITNRYTSIVGRHMAWTFLFIVPVLGWVLSDTCKRVARNLNTLSRQPWLPGMAAAVFAVGWAMYSPRERFEEREEYNFTYSQFGAIEEFFATLGPNDLIVTERDDAVLFRNIYPELGRGAYSDATNAIAVPYMHTRILFNPFFRRVHWKTSLTKTFAEAREKHLLDGVERLVFFYSLHLPAALPDMMLCPSFGKKSIVIPGAGQGHSYTRDEIENAMGIIVIVPKATFLTDVLSPTGKAHDCLDSKLAANTR
jgi:hypothetical protein